MALFRIKKDKEEKKTPVAVDPIKNVKDTKKSPVKKKSVKKFVKKASDTVLNYKRDIYAVILNPRVTEKATMQSENGVYVFDISPRAGKSDVAEAVKKLYNVTPVKVNITSIPSKKLRLRTKNNKFGTKSGGKKAYVYVKKGDTIDVV